MLPKAQRLDRAAIASFPKKNIAIYSDFASLRAVSAQKFGLAVVVSSKHEKKAVVRNRVRRRIYSIFGAAHKEKLIPFQILFYVSKKGYSASYGETKAAVLELIKKLR